MYLRKLKKVPFVVFVMFLSILTGFIAIIEPKLMLIIAFPLLMFAVIRFSLVQAKRVVGSDKLWIGMVVIFLWVLVINIPTFLAFDSTGFTKDHGLFNAQSLSRIGLFLIGCFALLYFWGRWVQDLSTKENSVMVPGMGLVLVFYGWFILEAPLVSEGVVYSALSIYRVMEWVLVIFMLAMVLSIQNFSYKNSFSSRLLIILPILLFLFFSNVILFLMSPGTIYHVSEITGQGRLGGLFTHPNVLALISVILFAYSLAFLSGWKRVLLLLMTLVVLFFTYSRGGYAELIVVLMLFVLFTFKHIFIKFLVFSILFIFIGIYLFMFNGLAEVLSFLARGQNPAGLTSLSERDAVWLAAKIMIEESPLLGEGFVSGPKKIGDLMIAYGFSHNFAAPHAHNEFLQTQLSGGVIATLLLVSIYFRIIFLLLKVRLFGNKEKFFLWSILLSVLIFGILKPVLSMSLSLAGVLVIWMYFILEYQYKVEGKLRQ